MAPDYFSVMATDSLSSVLPKWASWARSAKAMPILQKATYPFPNKNPKFLGTIVQKYRLRERETPSAAFKMWIDEIQKGVENKLIPALRDSNMLIAAAAYDVAGITLGQPLIQMSDFNSLIALSQKHKAPVFDLTDAQLEQTGVVLERAKESMQRFADLYSQGADRIITIIENA